MTNSTPTINFATIGKDGKDDSRPVDSLSGTQEVEAMPVLNFATIGKDGKDDSLLLDGGGSEIVLTEVVTLSL